MLKACVSYFLLFYQMIALQKYKECFFISFKKLFPFSRCKKFLHFFLLPTFPRFKRASERKWNNLGCHELACINTRCNSYNNPKIFSYIHHQTWSGNTSLKNIVNFLRLSDNPLSKCITFKRIYCMQWLFRIVYKN